MMQRFCTSSFTTGHDEDAFPSDLLSKKPLAKSERDVGNESQLEPFCST